MADETWVQQVRQQGDGAASRTDRDLTNRTSYLKQRLDAVELGQAVFARDVTLDPDLLVGQPAYWDEAAQRFAPAVAGVETDPDTGALVGTAASDCLGVVYAKELPDKGTLLLAGYAELDLANSAGADAPAGRYYLSASEPGKLVRQRPPVTVAVLYCDGAGRVVVQPAVRDFVEDHVHFSFELVCRPAGHADHPEPGARHAIKSPDVTARGWLPAALFGGRAPTRAAFGYNLAAHPELQRVWPPVPVAAAAVVWDKGADRAGGTVVPLGADGLVVLDRFGIWWMSDCPGDVPWPAATATSLSSYPAEPEASSDAPPECGRFERMRLTLSFARMTFATSRSVVTSLSPAADSPIRLVDCDGNAASTGDLFARFETDFTVTDNDTDGSLAVKEFDGSRFKRGYVVQGVLSGNDNLTVTGTRTKEIAGKTYAQGLLELSVNLDPAARDLPAQLVRLGDVKDRYYRDVMYLGMPPDQASEVRLKLKVPGAGLPASPRVKLRVQLLGRSAGTLPALTLTHRIVPRPDGATALPTADAALTFTTGQAVAADEYVEVEGEAVAVAAGDTLLYTLARADDAYSGEVGLLDVVGVLFAGG